MQEQIISLLEDGDMDTLSNVIESLSERPRDENLKTFAKTLVSLLHDRDFVMLNKCYDQIMKI